jgi:putative ABC transport system permease protein
VTQINLAESAENSDSLALAESVNGDTLSASSVSYKGKAVALDIYDVSHGKIRFYDKSNSYIDLTDDGAYICLRLAENVNIGDTVEISPYGSDESYTVRVAGFTRSVLTESITMTRAYADSVGIPYRITAVFTDEDASNIPAEDYISGTQSKQALMDSYDSFLEIMDFMVAIFILAAVVLGVVVLYNLGVMSYMERYRELATLKVVGFKDKRIGHILISQSLWITVAGVIIGLPGGIGILNVLITELASEYELKMVLGPLTYCVSILLTFGVSLAVGFFVSRKNKKIDMVEALKGAE